MINIQRLKEIEDPKIVVLGNHPGLAQSIIDFDFLVGKEKPSVVAVVGTQQRYLRYFWGVKQVSIPGYIVLGDLDKKIKKQINLFSTALSGRRAANVSEQALRELPQVFGGMIFAEGMPEQHSIQLGRVTDELGKFVLGPASVGLAIGGKVKLGAIGGTLPEQIVQSGIVHTGQVAVISTSGGMINELINTISAYGSGISFAAAVGGERFPLTKPVDLVHQALEDVQTKAIVYFGELGGTDEYEIADLLNGSKKRKPFIAYVAGSIAEKFEAAPQFGHAKALAQNLSETASAKKTALRRAGADVADSFARFESKLSRLPKSAIDSKLEEQINKRLSIMRGRSLPLFLDRISTDQGGEVKILGTPLLDFVSNKGLSEIALSMFLGETAKSQKLVSFFDNCVRLLVDHGPQVSGAVNSMITARAGKDLTASLASGLLTIGPRFGGAINQAAQSWFEAVRLNQSAQEFVETNARNRLYISGIGHKKYRADNPDPRVNMLLTSFDSGGPHITFAKKVADITTQKKAELILNVDGAIAALLLDLLTIDEKYSPAKIADLLRTDFCNAIFVYARTVSFIAHHLEQQRLDEGLFRLPAELISGLEE